MKRDKIKKAFILSLLMSTLSFGAEINGQMIGSSRWLFIDNFENKNPLSQWVLKDTRNDTSPNIENPQVTEIRKNLSSGNHFLLKKPAPEGIVGNRKALSYRPLPVAVKVGETYTFYVRIDVEKFPNNHIFGLSNLSGDGIERHDYNALEPSLRVTDKLESNGTKNDGTLMVMKEGEYSKVYNFEQGRFATPLQTKTWYEIWYVVNNAVKDEGGQKYDVYLRGGDEFVQQTKVFEGADFRMQRELPLINFLANCNTGPLDKPYGNGGLQYDDLYMAKGVILTSPIEENQNSYRE